MPEQPPINIPTETPVVENVPTAVMVVPAEHAPSCTGKWNSRDSWHTFLDALAIFGGPAVVIPALSIMTSLVDKIDTKTMTGFVLAGLASLGIQVLRRLVSGPVTPPPAPPSPQA